MTQPPSVPIKPKEKVIKKEKMIVLKSLTNELANLQVAFDQAILRGNSFAEVKKIYLQIKEVEKKIVERQIELLKTGRVED